MLNLTLTDPHDAVVLLIQYFMSLFQSVALLNRSCLNLVSKRHETSLLILTNAHGLICVRGDISLFCHCSRTFLTIF